MIINTSTNGRHCSLHVEQVTARQLKAGLEQLGKTCPPVDAQMAEKGRQEINSLEALETFQARYGEHSLKLEAD